MFSLYLHFFIFLTTNKNKTRGYTCIGQLQSTSVTFDLAAPAWAGQFRVTPAKQFMMSVDHMNNSLLWLCSSIR